MSDLVAFLRARYDEDEPRTRKLLAYAQQNDLMLQDPQHLGKWVPGWHEWPDVEQMCRDRLADVAAKRQVIRELAANADRYRPGDPTVIISAEARAMADWSRHLLRLLALPYVDHEDYREEWRP